MLPLGEKRVGGGVGSDGGGVGRVGGAVAVAEGAVELAPPERETSLLFDELRVANRGLSGLPPPEGAGLLLLVLVEALVLLVDLTAAPMDGTTGLLSAAVLLVTPEVVGLLEAVAVAVAGGEAAAAVGPPVYGLT